MSLTEKLGKMLIINIIVLVVLIVALLFYIQRGGEAEGDRIEALAEQVIEEKMLKENVEKLIGEIEDMPYLNEHPEELKVSIVQIGEVSFYKGFDEQGQLKPNPSKTYSEGEPIQFILTITNFMNPQIKEDYFLFGIEEYVETRDAQGRLIPSMTTKLVDISNHFTTKGRPLTLTNELTPDDTVGAETYTIKIIVYDKIAKLNQTKEEVIRIT